MKHTNEPTLRGCADSSTSSTAPVSPRKGGLLRPLSRGFTLIEIMVAVSIVAIGLAVAIPVYRNVIDNAKKTGRGAQARALVTATNLYRMKTGNAITGTAAATMTVTRANEIYAQIDGDIGNGEVIVESGFQLPSDAEFPAGFGETAAGVFTPIPSN